MPHGADIGKPYIIPSLSLVDVEREKTIGELWWRKLIMAQVDRTVSFVNMPFKEMPTTVASDAGAWDSLNSSEHIGVRHLWASVMCNLLGRASWRIKHMRTKGTRLPVRVA